MDTTSIVFTLFLALSDSDLHIANAQKVYDFKIPHKCFAAEIATNNTMPDLFWFCKKRVKYDIRNTK